MIIAILIGRRGSRGFPGKNIHKVLGRRLCEYPLLAAKKSKYIDKREEYMEGSLWCRNISGYNHLCKSQYKTTKKSRDLQILGRKCPVLSSYFF